MVFRLYLFISITLRKVAWLVVQKSKKGKRLLEREKFCQQNSCDPKSSTSSNIFNLTLYSQSPQFDYSLKGREQYCLQEVKKRCCTNEEGLSIALNERTNGF